MKGLRLSSLTGQLEKVIRKHDKKPVNAIKDPLRKLGSPRMKRVYADDATLSFLDGYNRLPLEALRGFSFDELCKMKYSSIFMMHETVRKLFEMNARYEVVRKIINSMWRWGAGTGTWNEIVDTYEGIRNFVFTDDPNFEIRLDHSTYHNEFGYAKYSRTFIDGVFAFLVYCKKKHVMTIGFFVMEGRKILIQQVQGAERSGNRYLYRLPKNRLEFVIELFQKNFPDYALHVIDGQSLVEKTLSDYRQALQTRKERCERYQIEIKNSTGEQKESIKRSLQNTQEEWDIMKEKISHLAREKERLSAFYRDTGRFVLSSTVLLVNNLKHHRVAS